MKAPVPRERPRAGLVAALAAALQAPFTAPAQEPELDWLDRDGLVDGEVLVRTARDGGSITVDTATLIDASPEAVWSVLTACEIAPEYVSNIRSCERVEQLDDGSAELFMQTIKPAFFIPAFEHVFRLDYQPFERIDVTEVSGPIDRMDGSWWLLREGDGRILLVHTLEVDPGFPIPRFILRATMKRDLTAVMEAVRERAEER